MRNGNVYNSCITVAYITVIHFCEDTIDFCQRTKADEHAKEVTILHHAYFDLI